MALFKRAAEVPADVVAGLGLEPGERVLARARCSDGSWVVATERRLLVSVDVAADQAPTAVPWDRVANAAWDDGVLAVMTTGDGAVPGSRHVLRLDDEGSLPETVRERVQASIVLSEHVRLDGRRGARISARRLPGASEVRWTVTFDAGLDAQDPRLRALADEAVARLKGSIG